MLLGGEILVHYRFGIGQGFFVLRPFVFLGLCLLGFFLVPGGAGLELFLLERFALPPGSLARDSRLWCGWKPISTP